MFLVHCSLVVQLTVWSGALDSPWLKVGLELLRETPFSVGHKQHVRYAAERGPPSGQILKSSPSVDKTTHKQQCQVE